mgnify:CR=1 FL=1
MGRRFYSGVLQAAFADLNRAYEAARADAKDRKSTRLNSSHGS